MSGNRSWRSPQPAPAWQLAHDHVGHMRWADDGRSCRCDQCGLAWVLVVGRAGGTTWRVCDE